MTSEWEELLDLTYPKHWQDDPKVLERVQYLGKHAICRKTERKKPQKPKDLTDWSELIADYKSGEMKLKQMLKKYHISQRTFYRILEKNHVERSRKKKC